MKLPIQNVKLPVRLIYDPPLTDDEVMDFSATNDVVWIEREPSGALYTRPIMDTANGGRATEIGFALHQWAERDGRGTCYSGAGWHLPDGSMRGACKSWALKERIGVLTKKQLKKFAPIAPDFVVEMVSVFDDPEYQRAKMDQWMANGVQVAWLIEAEPNRVTIFRAGEQPEVLEAPDRVLGSGVIEGFELEMPKIWDPWQR